MEEASYLMDRPVGGWSELVTNHTLDLKFAVVDERFAALEARFDALSRAVDARFEVVDAKFDALEHKILGAVDQRIRFQAWATITAIFTAMGMLGAFLKL